MSAFHHILLYIWPLEIEARMVRNLCMIQSSSISPREKESSLELDGFLFLWLSHERSSRNGIIAVLLDRADQRAPRTYAGHQIN